MTVFDFVNASIAPWTVIRIFTEDAELLLGKVYDHQLKEVMQAIRSALNDL